METRQLVIDRTFLFSEHGAANEYAPGNYTVPGGRNGAVRIGVSRGVASFAVTRGHAHWLDDDMDPAGKKPKKKTGRKATGPKRDKNLGRAPHDK